MSFEIDKEDEAKLTEYARKKGLGYSAVRLTNIIQNVSILNDPKTIFTIRSYELLLSDEFSGDYFGMRSPTRIVDVYINSNGERYTWDELLRGKHKEN